MQRTVHPHYLGVTARDQQSQERELRTAVLLALLPDEMREDMPLQMVDIHQRLVYGQRKSLGERHPHEQRAQEAGAAGISYRIYLLRSHPGLVQGLADHRHYILLMGAGCQFGHHPAVSAVHLLRGHHIGQQGLTPQHRCRRIVTRRFNSKYYLFCHISVFTEHKSTKQIRIFVIFVIGAKVYRHEISHRRTEFREPP